jgi:alkylhydroperoxidase family enzyme
VDRYESYPFTAREKAALRLAERLSLCSDEDVDELLMRDLQNSFNDAEIVELAMVIAILTGMTKMLLAFRLVNREPRLPVSKGGEATEHFGRR